MSKRHCEATGDGCSKESMMSASQEAGLTRVLAAHAADTGGRCGDAELELATRAVIDTVAVSLAATGDATVTTLIGALGKGAGGGPATVLATGERADARHAALVGGASAHALDFDDVDDAMIGHPSAVLVPTVLAVGEEVDATGRAILEAYWAGLTTCRALAAALDVAGHYAKGWHTTMTLGTLGAAASAGRLRGLSIAHMQHALGIAASLAGGSRQNFGTMTKPLHAGLAASNGVLASSLAGHGFSADPDQLEKPLGFLALFGADGPAPTAGTVQEAFDSQPAVNVKLYPCCYYAVRAADATLELVEAGLQADDVDRIEVVVHPGGLAPLIHSRPRTGLEAKFSLEYVLAACIADRELTLATFTDARVLRPQLKDLVERVRVRTADTPPVGEPTWDEGFAVVTAHTFDGEQLTRRIDVPRGHANRPVTDEELRAKLAGCLEYVGFGSVDTLHAALRSTLSTSSARAVTSVIADVVTDAGRAPRGG
jgi:2-methylcitrate dehydratase PrpD